MPAAAEALPLNALDCPAFPSWLSRHDGDMSYEWARIQWRRAHAVKGAWFDAAKADWIVETWPKIFTLTEDRFAGLPFRLNAWQEIIVRFLIGFKAPIEVIDPLTGLTRLEHVRLYRRLMLWIPRKNGKSEFLAALALVFFALEGTVGGQGYCFASDEQQARVVFDKMAAMAAVPPLSASVAALSKGLWIAKCRAGFKLLAGKPKGKHGRSASVIVGDEMHEWKSRGMMDVLRQSTGARLQPIELYASTAGRKSDRVGYELFEESQSILDGRIDDPTTLVVIFAANDNEDWRLEETWRRANPSIGLSPTIAFLRREAAYANDNPRAEAEFRCYHLNQFVDAHARWLNLRKWDACAPDATAWKRFATQLKGRACYGGFDVSSTRDVTALIWLFPPQDGETSHRLLARFWVPEETLAERVKNDHVDYDKWLAAGALETTPGDFVDQNFVKKAILEGFDQFDVQRLGYDSWNASKLIADLQADGVEPDRMLKVRQGIQSLAEPSKLFETRVYSGLLDHGGHPVMRWMAGNAVVRFDENLNFMPAKKRSAEKVDGIMGAVMATAAEISVDELIQGESVYEKIARMKALQQAA